MKSRMKVALFVNGFPDSTRPYYSAFNLRTALELSKHVDLTVIVPMALRPGRLVFSSEALENFEVVRVAGPVVPRMPRLSLRLFSYYAREKCRSILEKSDVIHSVGVEFVGLLVASWFGRKGPCHVSQMMNNVNALKGIGFKAYPFRSKLQRSVQGILCNSGALETIAKEHFPGVHIIRTIYRGTNLTEFYPEKSSPGPGAGGREFRFVFLGGLPTYPGRIYGQDTKGGITLMNAWSRRERDLITLNASLLFGGPGADCRQARRWRSSLRHPDRVAIQGAVPPQSVASLLRHADAVLIPSRDEGCPNLLFEAFACGTPVLGSDIGPLAEIIEHNKTGRMVKAGDTNAWGEALTAFACPSLDGIRINMGEAARRTAEAMFDNRNYALSLVDFYRSALQSRVTTREEEVE